MDFYFRTTRRGRVEFTLNEFIDTNNINNTTFNFHKNTATFSIKRGAGFKKIAKQKEFYKIDYETVKGKCLSKRLYFREFYEPLKLFHEKNKELIK